MNETNIQTQSVSKKKEKISINFKDGKYATGRRKKSVARVWITKGSGNIFVIPIEPLKNANSPPLPSSCGGSI